MFRPMSAGACALIALALGVSGQAQAAFVFTGSDASGAGITNSNNARNAWIAHVSSYNSDNLDGLAGSSTSRTSTFGNKFTTSDGFTLLSTASFNAGVISGTNLQVDRNSSTATFVWTLKPASNAFGFNTYDNDNGTITISFVDGTTQTYSFSGGPGSGSSSFWGITGLTTQVSTVTISTTDPGGLSNWDNFVTGDSLQEVPAPPALILAGIGAACLAGLRRWRKVPAVA